MSYEEKSIHEVVTEIDAGKYYLPALQRKFVWDEDRITLLFDSILRGYPISTFLFWYLKKQKADDYVFYEFLKRYDEREPYNKRKDGYFTQDEIIGVLDGQQRLSSIYIGLQGKYVTKNKYGRHDNPLAWPERELYINLLSTPFQIDETGDMPQVLIQEDKTFEIEFRVPSENKQQHYTDRENKTRFEYWFKLGEVIRWNENTSANDVFTAVLNKATDDVIKKELNNQSRFVIKLFESLRDKFIKEKIVSYFRTNKEDLEAILNIFVRVNSGALALSKSDLLFSTIIATWEQGREEIEGLQKDINKKGEGFSFTNDFIMRSLLVMTDLNVLFKVNSFKASNVELIKSNWIGIRKAILKTVDLLVESGLSGWLIPSQNAVIPIAYYVFKGGQLTNEAKNDLMKYLKHAFIKNVFGGQGDAVLAAMRNAIREKADGGYNLKNNPFIFNEFIDDLKLPADKSLVISAIDVDDLLETKKGIYSFLLLSMVYPNFKYGQVKLHQDHIHPYSGFKDNILTSFGFDAEQKQVLLNKRDMLPNLQLMEGSENQSKNDTPLKEWLDSEYPVNDNDDQARNAFLSGNYIDNGWSLDLVDFEVFFDLRKQKLKAALTKTLQLETEEKDLTSKS